MATYDGDITLSVSIKPNDVTAAAADIKKTMEDAFTVAGTKDQFSTQLKAAQISAKNLYTQINELQTKIAESGTAYTEPYLNLLNQLKALREEYDKFMARVNSGKIDLSTNVGAQQKLAELRDSIKSVSLELVDLKNNLGHGSIRTTQMLDDSAVFTDLLQKLDRVTDSATIAKDRLQEVVMAQPPKINAFNELKLGLAEIGKEAKGAVVNIAELAGAKLKSGLSSLGRAIRSVGSHTKSTNNILELGFKKFVQYGLGIRTVFLLVKRLRQAMIDGFGSIAQYSGEFNSIVSQFVSSLGTLKLTLATAFAPIATVILPLLTGLIDALIDAMNIIGKFFAALTGKSTYIQAKRVNKDYAASLNNTGASAGNAADGIDSATESAKELQKTIAGFDDVEILHEDKPDTAGKSGGSGGGGGSGGAGGSGISGADMFDTVGIESPIADFAKKLRELIAAQDWEGLGTFLGECINSIFRKAKDFISWDNLGDKITKIVNAITTTFNALVKAIDWDLIGSTFAEGINTLVKTLDLLYTGIDWNLLGTSIGTALKAFVRDIDWAGIGKLFGDKINAIIDLLYGIITTFDFLALGTQLFTGINKMIRTINWKKLGSLFAEAVNGVFNFLYSSIITFDWVNAASSLMSFINQFIEDVDWERVGQTISEFIKGALEFIYTAIEEFDYEGAGNALLELLEGIDWVGLAGELIKFIVISFATATLTLPATIGMMLAEAFRDGLGYLKESLDKDTEEAGGNIVLGLLKGIGDIVLGFGQWLNDNLYMPFMDTIKSLFGIASPSTVMEEQGQFIVEGLLNGITNNWPSVTKFLSKSVDGILSLILGKDWKQTGSDAIKKVHDGVSTTWETVSSFFKNGVDTVIEKFKGSDWQGTGETAVNKTHTGISGKWGTISSFFNTGVNDVSNWIRNFDWNGTGNKIVSKLKDGVGAVWDSNLANYIKTGIGNIGSYIKEYDWKGKGESVVEKLENGVSNNWYTLTGAIDDGIIEITEAFDDQDWSTIGSDICTGIQNGLNDGWEWVTGTAWNLAVAAFNSACEALGIASPSKLFRQKVGQMIPAGLAEGIEDDTDLAVRAVENLSTAVSSTNIPTLQMPDVALGKVIPPETNKNMDTLNESIKNLLDVIQFSQQRVITRDELTAVLNSILPSMLQRYVSFYISDEQIARHANAGNSSMNYRYNTVLD